MKYAILSDIHAYPVALKAALKDAKACGAEKVLCLGDVVGYGPDAVRTVKLARRECAVTLMGNHDAAVAGVIRPIGFITAAVRGVVRHREELSEADKNWLAQLPYVHEEPDFACAHGTLMDPHYFGYIMTAEDARASLLMTSKPLTFVGHTHGTACWIWKPGRDRPEQGESETFSLEPDCRYVVNVGSVGYPRREDCATYCIYDTDLKQVEFRRLPFDLAAYARELEKREIPIPFWLANRL